MPSFVNAIVKLTLFSLVPCLAGMLASGAADNPTPEKSGNQALYREAELYYEVRKLILDEYVKKPETAKLIESAVRGMMTSLDPYSEYYSPAMAEELKSDLNGEFGGIGVRVAVQGGMITIIAPIHDSPAYRAGVLSGDRLLEADGRSLKDLTVTEAARFIRGKPGTRVKLKVLHPGTTSAVDIEVNREIITMDSVGDARILDEDCKIGYLRITEFQTNTPGQLDKQVNALLQQDCKALIIDLRDNPGGSLDGCIKTCDRFIREGVIVSTKLRDGREADVYKARASDDYPALPLVTLIDQGSASASEIFAACMKDHKRGVLAGVTTFGKGSVQKIYNLRSTQGASVKMTHALYYTPSGASVDKHLGAGGVAPQARIAIPEEELKAIVDYRKTGENTPNQPPFMDSQLKEALRILKDPAEYAKLLEIK